MHNFLEEFKKNNLLKVIDERVDINLEIAHISYIEAKKKDSKVLLFTNVFDGDKKLQYPVVTNTFANEKALKIIFKDELENIASRLRDTLKPKCPNSLRQKFDLLLNLLELKEIFPKYVKNGDVKDIKIFKNINLFELPILKTWEDDGGRFITMGQVYLKDLDGSENLGMYRLQVRNKNELLVHFQVHKDGARIFDEYKRANKKMPIAVAIGGDPLYIWCAQAPMPRGIFELLLYGFLRKKRANLIKCETNEIFIPNDCDFVIEGEIDPNEFALEGPFGDHTGFYTPIDFFPVMKVRAITHKKDPKFIACVVGKPPLEDKFMGLATERIFLPLLQNINPDLIDYKMPENGCFHNLILAKMKVEYKKASIKLMHTLLGTGQMSFVKHMIIAPSNAPDLKDIDKFSDFVLNNISYKSFIFSEGIADELDHSSEYCYSSKLLIDATTNNSLDLNLKILKDEELLKSFKSICKDIISLHQIKTDSLNPITLISIDKKEKIKDIFKKLLIFKDHFSILIFTSQNNSVYNLYMSVWRITNNIDAKRDIFIEDKRVCIDATNKSEKIDNFKRDWPKEVACNKDVIKSLIARNLIKDDKELFEKFEII